MIWLVIWVVLMCLWLFGSGYIVYSGPTPPTHVAFFGGTLLPWLCVLILGLVIFGAVDANAGRQVIVRP